MRNKNLVKFTICCYLMNVFSVSNATVRTVTTATVENINSPLSDNSPPTIDIQANDGTDRTVNINAQVTTTGAGATIGCTDATAGGGTFNINLNNGGSVIANGANLAIDLNGANAGTLAAITTNAGSIITGGVRGTPTAATTFNIDGGSIAGAITGGTGADVLNIGATLATTFATGGTISNIPTIATVTAGTEFTVANPITNVITVFTVATDTTATLNATVSGAGTATTTNNGSMIINSGTYNVQGNFVTTAGSSTTINDNVNIGAFTFTNDGTVIVTGNRTLTATTGGYVGTNVTSVYQTTYADSLNCVAAAADLGMNGVLTVTGFSPAGTYNLISTTGTITQPAVTNYPTTLFADYNLALIAGATNNLQLTVDRTTKGGFAGVAASSQGRAIGTVLESIGGNAPSTDQLTLLSAIESLTTIDAADNALQQLTPASAVSSIVESSLAVQNESLGTVEYRLAALKEQQAMTGMSAGDLEMMKNSWLKFFGNSSYQKKKDGLDGYRIKSGGLAIGYDHQFEALTIGISVSYARSQVDNKINRATKTNINSLQAMLYGSCEFADAMFIDAFATGTYNDYSSKRAILFGGINRVATASYRGKQFSTKASLGKHIELAQRAEFTPLSSIQFTYLKQNRYDETGAAAANLHVASRSANRLQIGVGGKFGFPSKSANNAVGMVTPYIQPMVMYDIANKNLESTANFIAGGSTFNTAGINPGKLSGNISVGFDIKRSEHYQFSLNYNYTGKARYSGHAGYINFNYKF